MRVALQITSVVLFAAALAACGSSPSAPSGSTTGQSATPTPAPTPEPTPAPTPEPTPEPTPDPGPTVLREATFQSANGYFTEGRAAIIRESGSYRLQLRSDFRTSQSGALDVRLCSGTACGPSDLDLGGIQAYSGAQRYGLPDDGGQYSHVVIWCRAVNLPFGHGQLR